jgi:hypothetical protein
MLSASAMQKDVPGDPAVSSTPLETPLHMRLYTELPNLQKLPQPCTRRSCSFRHLPSLTTIPRPQKHMKWLSMDVVWGAPSMPACYTV